MMRAAVSQRIVKMIKKREFLEMDLWGRSVGPG